MLHHVIQKSDVHETKSYIFSDNAFWKTNNYALRFCEGTQSSAANEQNNL